MKNLIGTILTWLRGLSKRDPHPTTPIKPPQTMAWGMRVNAGFRTKVREIADALGVEVDYLMAIIAFETGYTFSPSARNKVSGATGLIQFMPRTAVGLGTTTTKLQAMTAVEQLDYVQAYFTPYIGRLKTLSDVYMAVLWPRAIGKSDDYVLFTGNLAYTQNAGLDLNKDKAVTKFEAAHKIYESLEVGRRPENLWVGRNA